MEIEVGLEQDPRSQFSRIIDSPVPGKFGFAGKLTRSNTRRTSTKLGTSISGNVPYPTTYDIGPPHLPPKSKIASW
jgi:hypothetical protein